MKLPEVVKVSQLSGSTIRKLERLNRFPARKKIGLRAIGWLRSDIANWVAVTSGKTSSTADEHIED